MRRIALVAVLTLLSACSGAAGPTTVAPATTAIAEPSSATTATTATPEPSLAEPNSNLTEGETTTTEPSSSTTNSNLVGGDATTTTTAAPSTTATTAAPTTTTTTTTTAAPTTTTTTTTTSTTTTTTVDYVALGSDLATESGCRNCHSTDGSVGLGPSWRGLAGSTVTLADGSTVTATSGYLAESIRAPDAKIVEGFPAGLMQTVNFTDDEIQALVAYIATL